MKLHPSKEQKAILIQWFGDARFAYNYTVERLNRTKETIHFYSIRKEIMLEFTKKYPFLKRTPYDIKANSIKDACTAVSNAKLSCKKNKIYCNVTYRTKKDDSQSIYIPKANVRKNLFYTRKVKTTLNPSKSFENPPMDCMLNYKRHEGFYFIMPEEIVLDNQEKVDDFIALDPGTRTFMTGYSQTGVVELGVNDMGKINRLKKHLNQLRNKKKSFNGKRFSRKRNNINKAIKKATSKIQHLVEDAHWKIAKFLTVNYKYVFIPKFNVSDMVKRSSETHTRKISKKTVKDMLNWNHYKFRQRLIHQAKKYNCTVCIVNESYTTQTCSSCGYLHTKIGSKKIFNCPGCSIVIDRDINAARGIYLRALVGYAR